MTCTKMPKMIVGAINEMSTAPMSGIYFVKLGSV